MDGIGPGPLNGEAIDRELDAAVNVDPSPEFLARVRTRIAAEPIPQAPWRQVLWPSWATATVVVALALSAGLWRTADREGGAAPPVPPASAENDVSLPTADNASNEATPAVRPRRAEPATQTSQSSAPAMARQERAAARPDEPEVVISAAEQRAFVALLDAIRDRRLPPLPQRDEGASSLVPAPLDIEPVIVEPLQIARLEQESIQ